MSKGVQLPTRKKEPIVRVRQGSPISNLEVAIDIQPQTCWTFKLAETTEAAQQAVRGMFIFAIKQGARILVLADLGLLGFVPSSVASKINTAIEIKGGELKGEVVSTNFTETEILVKVCLY